MVYKILHLPTGTYVANDMTRAGDFSFRFFLEEELNKIANRELYNLVYEFSNKEIFTTLKTAMAGDQTYFGVAGVIFEHFELVEIEDE